MVGRNMVVRLVVVSTLMTFGGIGAMAKDDKPRDLDTHHLFTPPPTREAWLKRRSEIRNRILFSAGLLPMPEKTPLHPLVTGRIEGPDFTVENVALETRPGFFLCGNLYRPKEHKGRCPAIVNPHGHWEHGRLEMQPDVERAPAPPGKMGAGRGNLVAIGVNLAKQGYVVFAYDMAGYNDTSQMDHRGYAADLRSWLWGVSILGLQLWDSIRVVDYLSSLPDVDPKRIGATGASGGGTQTFLLTAVDDRIAAAVPVNMVSAYMQGGCLCENGPGLRVGTDNPEIAATMAPRPQLLIAATGDWTAHVPEEEAPAIRKVYALFDAADHLDAKQFNYEHNYNVESREAMYAFFGRWLLHDTNPEHFKEKPFDLDSAKMRVWSAEHPMPARALKSQELIEATIQDSEKQLAQWWPSKGAPPSRAAISAARQSLSEALAVTVPSDSGATGKSGPQAVALVVSCPSDSDSARRAADALRARKIPVVNLPLEPLPAGLDLWAKFYSCYNRTPLGDRVQQIVDAIESASREHGGVKVDVVGLGPAGLWSLFARAIAPHAGRGLIDVAGFDNRSDEAFVKSLYAPGLRRAGDIRAAALIGSSAPLALVNTGSQFDSVVIQAAYASNPQGLTLDGEAWTPEKMVAWLARR